MERSAIRESIHVGAAPWISLRSIQATKPTPMNKHHLMALTRAPPGDNRTQQGTMNVAHFSGFCPRHQRIGMR
jgi:hypothetical protein